MEHIPDALKQPAAVGILEMVREWKGMGENMLRSLVDYVSDMESREKELSAARDSLEERLKDLEEREKRLSPVCEYSNEEFESRERELDEQLNLVHEHIERLEMAQSDANGLRLLEREKLKVIEKREKEIEQREKEFKLLRDEKLREIVSKEEAFAEEVRLVNKKLRKRDGLCRVVIEKLDSGLNMVEGLKVKIDEKIKSQVAILGEANLIRESLEKKFEEMEKEFKSVQEDKMQELKSKERKLSDIQKEIEIRKKDLENMEKKFEFYRERKMGELMLAEENLRLVGKGFIEEVILREEKFDKQDKMMRDLLERLELARKKINDMNTFVSERFKNKMGESEHEMRIKLEEDVVMFGEKEVQGTKSDFQLKDFGKDLEMLINDTEKDLELIGAEVFKVYLLSSDPAQLVLDAIKGFVLPYLGKGDMELNVRRKSAVLLDQLTKMSPSIQPCVKEAAIKVAGEWKLKMGTGENSLDVLGFLHFLAAYNLSFCFDKDELLSMLKMVAQHKQAPELSRILGLSDNITGFVQNLINESRYILASTYIHECGLECMFSQAAVLNYHVQHLKAKRRRENTSPEALNQAFASEIADLHAAIKHVIKYGLESEYSPNLLTSRIKVLEGNRASLLRNRTVAQKQKNPKRFTQNKAATAVSSTAPKAPKYPVHNSENGPYPSWKARYWQSKTENHIAETNYDEVLATQHWNMTSKRRKLTRGWTALRRCTPLDGFVRASN